MDKLLAYLNNLDAAARDDFAARCKTSVGYIRKVVSLSKSLRFGVDLCIAFERESRGAVRCEDVRPDVDWAFLRGTAKAKRPAHA